MKHAKCLVFLFVLTSTKFGTALKCYVCSTPKDKCWDTFDKTAHDADICDVPNAVCIKQILPPTGKHPQSVHRICAIEGYCSLYEKEVKYCFTCNKDLCNSSRTTSPSVAFLAVSISLYYLSLIITIK